MASTTLKHTTDGCGLLHFKRGNQGPRLHLHRFGKVRYNAVDTMEVL